MTLLKGDKTITKKLEEKAVFSITDGWNFGIGFGLAMTIAMPVILVALGLIASIVILVFGAFL